MEWAPKVRVNAVSGGLIATEDSLDHYGGEEGLARVAATVPMARFGTPGDMADAVLFLASPLAGYVTGGQLVLHGGGEWPAFLRAGLTRSEGARTAQLRWWARNVSDGLDLLERDGGVRTGVGVHPLVLRPDGSEQATALSTGHELVVGLHEEQHGAGDLCRGRRPRVRRPRRCP